jgi:hypothetical protein
MLKMLERLWETIRFELFVIKEVVKTMWEYIRATRSLRPVVSMLNPNSEYDLNDGQGIKKGNYYNYIKDMYSVDYRMEKGA